MKHVPDEEYERLSRLEKAMRQPVILDHLRATLAQLNRTPLAEMRGVDVKLRVMIMRYLAALERKEGGEA